MTPRGRAQRRQQSRRDDAFAQQLEGRHVPEEEDGALVVPQVAVGDGALKPAARDDAVETLVSFERSAEERHQEENRQRREGGQES